METVTYDWRHERPPARHPRRHPGRPRQRDRQDTPRGDPAHPDRDGGQARRRPVDRVRMGEQPPDPRHRAHPGIRLRARGSRTEGSMMALITYELALGLHARLQVEARAAEDRRSVVESLPYIAVAGTDAPVA